MRNVKATGLDLIVEADAYTKSLPKTSRVRDFANHAVFARPVSNEMEFVANRCSFLKLHPPALGNFPSAPAGQ